jgi:hypothetical protein
MSDDQAPCATPATDCEPSEVQQVRSGADLLTATIPESALPSRVEEVRNAFFARKIYKLELGLTRRSGLKTSSLDRLRREMLESQRRARRGSWVPRRPPSHAARRRRCGITLREHGRTVHRACTQSRGDPEPSPPDRPVRPFSQPSVGRLAYLTRALRVGATWAEPRAFGQPDEPRFGWVA